MSIKALPPYSDKPDDGGDYYVCNHFEWAAATLEKGESCWFTKKGWPTWKRGTYISSYMYDGIIASVYEDDPDDMIKHSLFLDMGDALLRLEDYPAAVAVAEALTK